MENFGLKGVIFWVNGKLIENFGQMTEKLTILEKLNSQFWNTKFWSTELKFLELEILKLFHFGALKMEKFLGNFGEMEKFLGNFGEKEQKL